MRSMKNNAIIANSIINNDGIAAIFSCSALAYSKVKIDNVLKLKGLKTSVAGSSFKISI